MNRSQSIKTEIRIVLLTLGAIPPALAQTGGEPPDPTPIPRTLTLNDYKALVSAALPATPPTAMLTAPPGPNWFPAVSVGGVAAAMQDTTPDQVWQNGPRTEARDSADTRVIKIDGNRGRIRYINRMRAFAYDSSPHVAVSAAQAGSTASAVLDALGLPVSERGPSYVDVVMGQIGAVPGVQGPTHQRERLVTVDRVVSGYPIFDSTARVVVSNTGQRARLLVRWPRFALPSGLTLRARQSVVDDLAQRIYDAEKGAAPNDFRIVLGYARSGAGHSYLPVALAKFWDPDSGLGIVVPLVNTPADRDLDGVSDTSDNCPDSANPFQEDREADGVGDECDNCRDTVNSAQADADADGVGDACQPVECFDSPYDSDTDGDVDAADLGRLQVCFTGLDATNAWFDPIACSCFDVDNDQDVDVEDFVALVACLAGPETATDPSCAGGP